MQSNRLLTNLVALSYSKFDCYDRYEKAILIRVAIQ